MLGSHRRSTTLRVSLGIASLTICMLLGAEMMGLLPDKTEVKLEARQKSVELVAVQVAAAATRNDIRLVQTILSTIVERDGNVLSAALSRRGTILAVAGAHEELWEQPENGGSTPTHVQVPIMSGESEWGLVEITFEPIHSIDLTAWRDSPLTIFAFVGLVGFLLYFAFLRRVLRELDPSNVVPEHVRSAFNALAEGVIIIDTEERIVLANQEFANMMERPAEALIGLNASELDWQTGRSNDQHPWQQAMSEGKSHMGGRLSRLSSEDESRVFMVNGAPILDTKGRSRGAIATFDDVSEIEKKNAELKDAMTNLNRSREAVKLKNKELQHLATRDPLTGLLNRRALFELFESRFENAKTSGTPLSGIMIDIDNFKSVNDRYGHSVGDEVIQFVADKLKSVAKFGDLSGRYGGEEFFLILPGTSLDDAAALAQRLRMRVSHEFAENFSLNTELTISLGVASLLDTKDTTTGLLNRADNALYVAKTNGRNRVVRWGDPELDVTEERRQAKHESNAELVRRTMTAG